MTNQRPQKGQIHKKKISRLFKGGPILCFYTDIVILPQAKVFSVDCVNVKTISLTNLHPIYPSKVPCVPLPNDPVLLHSEPRGREVCRSGQRRKKGRGHGLWVWFGSCCLGIIFIAVVRTVWSVGENFWCKNIKFL